MLMWIQRDFKDAEVYLLRYQQCMTRSMTLIKIYFVNALKAIGQEVGKRLVDRVSKSRFTLCSTDRPICH